MEDDLVKFIFQFHKNVKLPKAIDAFFLALIQKHDNPQELGEYKPSFMVGNLYKIIAKILTSRTKMVLGKFMPKC